MGEPLKDRVWYTQGDIYGEPKPKPLDLIEHKVVVFNNLKSAVEWLNENIDKIAPRHKTDYTTIKMLRENNWKLCNCKTCSKIKEIKELIKKAFPDLVKTNKGE